MASSDPVPGAGPAAAWTCALAAALVEMVCAVMARREGDQDAARAGHGERAAAIRAAALELAGRDMDAYREVLAARSSADAGLRRAALAAAADPPLEIAAAAAELTALAAEAFAAARGGVRGEAATAAVLAEAATRAAAAIVSFNLAGDPGDPRRVRASELIGGSRHATRPRRGGLRWHSAYRERPADGEPAGLLVLHHGRGSDELDMMGLGEALDPLRRLHLLAPRAPLALPGAPGWHWYVVERIGYPDPDSFAAAVAQLAALHDEVWERTGIGPERTVLGGFSQGAVMSYALALAAGRPAPAGLLALSGFIPTVQQYP